MSTDERLDLAHHLAAVLTSACPGSEASLRGSLAAGSADEFSDIDLLWIVPNRRFGAALGSAPAAIASVRPLRSLRSDPDLHTSPSRRLLFARLVGVPVWWRLDLEVRTDAPGIADGAPLDSSAVMPWDPYESALENALAAIKARGRGQSDQADGLLDRGFARIEHPSPEGDRDERIQALVASVVRARPHLARLAESGIDQLTKHLS